MKKIDQLKKKREEPLEVLRLIDEEITLLESKTKVECTNNNYGYGCGRKHEVRKLQYIQTHWYETPSGCMGGDTWHQGEGNFDCPKCGHRNRLYNREEIQELKYLFGSIIDEHEK